MEDIKIAIIDNVGIKAGMDYYDLSLLKSLSKLSAKTFLFSNFKKDDSDIEIKKVFSPLIKNRFLKGINYIKGFLKAYFFCKIEKIEWVILHIFEYSYFSFVYTLMAKALRLKVIIIAHDILSFSNKDKIFVKKYIFNRLADKIVVHNNFSYKELKKSVSDKTLNKIFIIKQGNYLGLIKNFSKQEAKEQLGLDKKHNYILFFGQIKKVKRLDLLLKAMPLINENIKLIIAGKPWKDDFLYYKRIIDKLNIENRVIKMIRYISNTERDLLFSASDAFILPYDKIYQSAVQLMGMSYGLPIIASDLEPNKEIIKNKENGILFKKGDHLSLADAVNELICNKKMLREIAKLSLQTVKEEYSWDKIVIKYLEIIKK